MPRVHIHPPGAAPLDGGRTANGASATRSNSPRGLPVLPAFASTFAVRFGGPGAALECPKHIADTQALIDRVSANMEQVGGRISNDAVGLVYDLLDDARMLLAAARKNHEMPQGPYDHARAYAKADAALGHARAAEVLQSRCGPVRPGI